MAEAAHDMADGRYDRRVYTASMDEVGELAEAFNRMAAELAAVDTERRELIANVSHELRTPISAMQAVMENIVDDVAPVDPATMRTMLAQVERLGRLVAQLLDLSRLDARDARIDPRPFPVAPLLEAAVGEAEISIRRVLSPDGLPHDRRASRTRRHMTPRPTASRRSELARTSSGFRLLGVLKQTREVMHGLGATGDREAGQDRINGVRHLHSDRT